MTGPSVPETLICQVRSGDADALAQLIQAWRPRLLAVIQQKMSHKLVQKIEPDDILQETSADCVKSLANIDLTDRDLFGWLCQVAERRIIDAHRRLIAAKKREADRELPLQGGLGQPSQAQLIDLLVVSMTTPSQAFSRDQREFRVQQAISALPDESRDALRLRYVDGLSTRQIAGRLGKSDGAVRVLLTRSLKRLQTSLGDTSLG